MRLLRAYHAIAHEIPSLVLEFQNATPVVINGYAKRLFEYGLVIALPLDQDADEIEGFEPVTIQDLNFTFETDGTAPIRDPLAVKLAKDFLDSRDRDDPFEPGKVIFPTTK